MIPYFQLWTGERGWWQNRKREKILRYIGQFIDNPAQSTDKNYSSKQTRIWRFTILGKKTCGLEGDLHFRANLSWHETLTAEIMNAKLEKLGLEKYHAAISCSSADVLNRLLYSLTRNMFDRDHCIQFREKLSELYPRYIIFKKSEISIRRSWF